MAVAKKYLILFSISAMLIVIFITGCGGTSSSKILTPGPGAIFDSLDAGKIQGTIHTQDNKTPIKGAIVETFELQAVTGEDGRFLIGPMPAGDYRLIARAPGFAATVQEGVRVYAGRITENIDYQLTPQTASYSPDFAVIALVPFTGTDGDIITVYCSGCGSERGRVTFNGKDATVIDWNTQRDDRILVQLPQEVETGPVRVIINDKTSTETQPQLFIGRPVILKADPAIAQAGQIIHITGRNFNPIDRFNRVTLKGDACSVTSVVDSTKLQIQLPINAKTGEVAIRIEGNEYQLDGISNVIVTIKPEILHISPKRSVANVPLTIFGKNFGDNVNNVKVNFGGYIINSSDIETFSDTKLSFMVPDNTILPQGRTAEISVLVNDAKSNGMSYTAYNSAFTTIADYGMYDFNTVSSNGTMRMATLRPTDRIAFLSVLSGNSDQDLGGEFFYSFSGFLGGNFELVPTLQANIRAAKTQTSLSSHVTSSNYFNTSLRASMAEPASNTMPFYVRDFTSANPWDATNDILATATLKASGSMSLVYYDQNTTGLTDLDAAAISARFDGIYNTLATACWDGLITSNPPEGNVDAQRRIVIFISPILEQANLGERLVAYFDPRDKDLAAVNTAGTEIIYANPRGFIENKDDFYGGLAETLQFMMYYNQKERFNEGVQWQKMGLSTFARQEVGLGFKQQNQRAVSWVSQYLQNPDNVSMNHWPDSPTYADYGMAYLFTQYMFDRCGGYNAIAAMERQSGFSGLEHIDNFIIRPNTPLGLRDFFHDYAKALYCDNLGLKDTFANYNKNIHQFSSIKLRSGVPGVEGLRNHSFGENPVTNRIMPIKGYGCSLIEYNQGNWGDLEIRMDATPSAGDFRTWVIFYSAEQIASGT